MTRWEYKVENVSIKQVENQLNFIGEQGWELVCIDDKVPVAKTGDDDDCLRVIFKRPSAVGGGGTGWFGS